MRSPIFSLLTLSLIACQSAAEPQVGNDDEPSFAEPAAARSQRLIVVRKPGQSFPDELDIPGTTRYFGLHLHHHMQNLDAAVYTVPEGMDAGALAEALRSSGQYAAVETEAEYAVTSEDGMSGVQWNMRRVNADNARTLATGDGVIVAVIDTGVTDGGPDGIAHILPGYDFVNDDNDPMDDYGHGTHVAGTIAQRTDNYIGVAGLAPEASILPIKVCNASGSCTTSDIVDGILYAVANGADVINMSLGGSEYSGLMGQAVAAAREAGVIVVCAAGNGYGDAVSYPAAYPGAWAVSATTSRDTLASFSNVGPEIFLAAPGASVTQETIVGGRWSFQSYSGTSMASPHVAASAALMLSAGATPDDAERLLAQTAFDMGAYGTDEVFGHGLVQPAAALQALAAERAAIVPLHGDIDGDGAEEMVTWNPANGAFFAINSAGDTLLSDVFLGGEGDQPALGDFDGDGVAELAVWSASDSTWSAVDQDGVSVFSGVHLGAEGDVAMLADLDGDGDDDLVSWRPSSGEWTGKRIDGQMLFRGLVFGSSTDLPMVLDLDGDGVSELGIYSTSSGKWGAIDTSGAVVLDRSVGRGNELPVAGDVNHNGADDFGTWRRVNGQWTIKAANNQVLVRGLTLGDADAVPMLADLDGDGAAELVVFSPSWGTWSAMSVSGERLFDNL